MYVAEINKLETHRPQPKTEVKNGSSWKDGVLTEDMTQIPRRNFFCDCDVPEEPIIDTRCGNSKRGIVGLILSNPIRCAHAHLSTYSTVWTPSSRSIGAFICRRRLIAHPLAQSSGCGGPGWWGPMCATATSCYKIFVLHCGPQTPVRPQNGFYDHRINRRTELMPWPIQYIKQELIDVDRRP
ncbi:hypothetical protein BJV77DRAFT_322115 [Russula vinacea]|nr:hypothetical protein BJV77DRAFT_322115 [Russula vinacea]